MLRILAIPLALVALQTSSYESSVRPLSPALKATLSGTYWKPGCPVPLSQLRVLTVRHWGFDGRARTGQLIVNRDVADPLRSVFRQLYEGGSRSATCSSTSTGRHPSCRPVVM